MAFFFEVLITGLLVGIMYSLVALGFALIYKASDVFNFAQGDMSLLAGLALVGFLEFGMPLWVALICTIVVMTILAYSTVFIVLRPLVARPPLILFMSMIGLSFLIQGIGQVPAFQVVIECLQVGTIPGYCLGTFVLCSVADLVVVDEL